MAPLHDLVIRGAMIVNGSHVAVRLHRPTLRHDLPGCGRRRHQCAEGYVATIVNGAVIAGQGIATGALPGRLLRGPQASSQARISR